MGLSYSDYQMLLRRFDQIDKRLVALGNQLGLVQQQEGKIMAQLDDITSAVEEETTVNSSAITLLTQLAQSIESLKNDPAALSALATQIRSNSSALAAAVTANTPAAPST
jgi:tRNA U34 5-carboxymethylaminomethyl modifying enzyme MnmG/GidA